MKQVRFADLDAWVVPSASSANIQGAASDPAPSSCVVLLHGYGAPGTDLVPLAQALNAPPGTLFVFPQAPHGLDDNDLGPYAGRAWWPIDMARLQVAALTGRLERLADEHPPGMDEARAQLTAFLNELLASLGLSEERLILGGFSQGAMLSCDWALRDPRRLAGLVLLSGTTLCQDEWFPCMASRQGLPVFQSHGTDDPILPYSLAERLHSAWRAAGADARFIPFAGAHGIAPPVLSALSSFLREHLG